MAQFKIIYILQPKHWLPFHALVHDQRMMVDDLCDWLDRKGYVVSRSSVGRYMKHCRAADGSLPTAGALGCRNDGQLRRKLAECGESLSDTALASLVLMGVFLVNARGGGEKVRKPAQRRIRHHGRTRGV